MSYQETIPGTPYADLGEAVIVIRSATSYVAGSAALTKLCLSSLVHPSFNGGDYLPVVASATDVPGLVAHFSPRDEEFVDGEQDSTLGYTLFQTIDAEPATYHVGEGELCHYLTCRTGFEFADAVNLNGDFTVICLGVVRETEPNRGGLLFALEGGGARQFGVSVLNDEIFPFLRDLGDGFTTEDLALQGAAFDDVGRVLVSLWREGETVSIEVGPLRPDLENGIVKLLTFSNWQPPREHVDGSAMSLLVQVSNEWTDDPIYPVVKDCAFFDRALSAQERAAVRNGFLVRDQMEIGAE